ncbi:hypothetical protein [uncultured Lamprocystis sp.]|jgi:hypothetical protein|uniref:hypothetical protein n=1 Tax=uncultured Lamprocystis sp. TaxID=543132 RepID=UPI0025D353CD|nr:hypothetical protein [uncultured Lamprocystis sp.]
MNKMSAKWWVGLLGLMLALPLAAVPVGRLGIPAGPVAVGTAFNISVFADGVGTDEVIAFGFDHAFDATWTLLSTVVGPLFDYDDSALFTNTAVAGSMDPGHTGPGGDNILLATLTLVPSVAGLFDFHVISDRNDPNEGLFLVNGATALPKGDLTTSTQVEVSAAPAPGSLALLALGLAAWFPRRHYRRAALALHR